jgi:hypothetical protein
MIVSILFTSISLAFAGSSEADLHTSRRRLSYEKIAGYTPETLVTSHVRMVGWWVCLFVDSSFAHGFACISSLIVISVVDLSALIV